MNLKALNVPYIICKAHDDTYKDILEKLGAEPENCIMVGNDVDEDIRPAQKLGMGAFLLTPCILNRSGSQVSCPQGGFAELKEFLLNQL